ncbi:unnamed protein product, partial [Darwinula stevensoni]
MANCSEAEELHVDGKTVADVIARYTVDLKYINHDGVIELLLTKKVIDLNEHVSIQKSPKTEKILFLQEKLPQKGDTAFQKFLESLEEKGHRKLALKMRRVIHIQLENEKKRLEALNQEMAHELDVEKRQKVQLERRIKELEEQLKKEQNAKSTIQKELQESRDQAAKQMLHMSAVEKKAKELEELVKREQNAYGELERNKRKIEKELKEKVDELQQQLDNMRERPKPPRRKTIAPRTPSPHQELGTQMSREYQEVPFQSQSTRVL